MSEKRQRKVLKRLEDFPMSDPAIIMLKDGSQRIGHVYGIDQDLEGNYSLIYSVGGIPDVEGSKVDPKDRLPSIPFHELGYVQSQTTDRKVSLMPFQRQVV